MNIAKTLRNLSLGFGIIILLPLTVYTGIKVFSPYVPLDYREIFDFLVTIIAGIIAILFGSFTRVTFLGYGFILGGVISVVRGYVFHWMHLSDLMRFISLIIALAVIIAVGFIISKRQKKFLK